MRAEQEIIDKIKELDEQYKAYTEQLKDIPLSDTESILDFSESMKLASYSRVSLEWVLSKQ